MLSKERKKESFFKIIQSWNTYPMPRKMVEFHFLHISDQSFCWSLNQVDMYMFFGGNLSCEFSQIFSQYQFHFYDFSCRVAKACSWVILIFLLLVILFGRFQGEKKSGSSYSSNFFFTKVTSLIWAFKQKVISDSHIKHMKKIWPCKKRFWLVLLIEITKK